MATVASSHVNTIGSLAAGKLLARAASGRWGPLILILAGIVLFHQRRTLRAALEARAAGASDDETTNAPH